MSKNITALKCPNCDAMLSENSKRCEYCGSYITLEDTSDNKPTGNTVEQPQYQPNIIVNINNAGTTPLTQPAGNPYNPYQNMRAKDKWVAFFLCLFLGFLGAHKFYENKGGMGVLYLFTGGLFGIGWFIDIFSLLAKPNPYYVH